MTRGLAQRTIVIATALPALGVARLAETLNRDRLAARARAWAAGTPLGVLLITAPLWLIVLLRGLLYPAFGGSDLGDSWGGPSLAGAWAVHLTIGLAVLLGASFLLACWCRRRERSQADRALRAR